MRLRGALADEPLDEVAVIGLEVVGIDLAPALRYERRAVVERLHPRVGHDPPPKPAEWTGRKPRTDEDRGGDPLGVLGGEEQGTLGAEREADDHRRVGAGRIQHVDRVLGELRLGISADLSRAVALPVAARVEHDDPVAACEVGDLHLPDP